MSSSGERFSNLLCAKCQGVGTAEYKTNNRGEDELHAASPGFTPIRDKAMGKIYFTCSRCHVRAIEL